MDNKGAVTAEVVLRTTVRTRLRLNKATRDSLWSLRQQQREFYNKGVEIALFAHGNGDYREISWWRSCGRPEHRRSSKRRGTPSNTAPTSPGYANACSCRLLVTSEPTVIYYLR